MSAWNKEQLENMLEDVVNGEVIMAIRQYKIDALLAHEAPKDGSAKEEQQ